MEDKDKPDLHRLRSYSKQLTATSTSTPVNKPIERTVSFQTNIDTTTMSKEGKQEVKTQKVTDVPSKTRPGGFGFLGARLRSFSSGTKKSASIDKPVQQDAPSQATFQIPSNQSKTSLAEEAKKTKRSSSFFNTFSGSSNKKKSSVAFPEASSPHESSTQQEASTSPSRRPRLSMPGLSHRSNRTPSQSPFELTTSPPALEADTSPGDFNLKGFRNVRRQSSYFSYNVPEDPKGNAGTSPLPRSSATQYALSSSEDVSRPRTLSLNVSPRLEYPYQSSGATTPFESSLVDSKSGSPISEGTRSIPAGKFRQIAASNRRMDDQSGGASKTTSVGSIRSSLVFSETLAKHGRPGSPFLNLNGNPNETMAALEAEISTPPASSFSQGSEEGSHSLIQPSDTQSAKAPSLIAISEMDHVSISKAEGEDNDDQREDEQPDDGKGEAPPSSVEPGILQQASLESASPELLEETKMDAGIKNRSANRMSMLPWLQNDSKLRRSSIASATSSNNEITAHSGLMETLDSTSDLHGALAYGEIPTFDVPGAASLLGHAMMNNSAYSTTDHEYNIIKPSLPEKSQERETIIAEPNQVRPREIPQAHEIESREESSKEDINDEKTHRRISSVPFDFHFKSQSTPSLHHQLSSETLVQSSSTVSSLHSRALELLSFHDKQAPSLLAAQNRSQLQPDHSNRIAWPTPACVKVDYFAKLPPIYQHSLYEQHCKAADHAMAEYLRLMAEMVPPHAMTQPSVIFPTSYTQHQRDFNEGPHDVDYSQSRSTSLTGALGGGLNGRRRGSAGTGSNKIPVPPLPSREDLEKLEAKARYAHVNDYSQFRRKSDTVVTPRSRGGSNTFPPDDKQWKRMIRQPSARFMMSQYQTRAPLDAFDGKKMPATAVSRSKTIER